WTINAQRDSVFVNAMDPLRATLGDSSGPAPFVNCRNGPPSNGMIQRFVAPARFDWCMRPLPSGVKTGRLLKTPGRSFDNRRGEPSFSGTSQSSPAIPPALRTTATWDPSGDQTGFRKKG